VSRRRRVGFALVAFGCVALGVGLTADPVHAQAPDQTGWWFEAQTKTLPLPVPSPPNVPADGMFVQQGPNGPTAFGAIRARVPSAASVSLTLAAAQGSTTSLGAPLQACATTAPWQPPAAAPGYWEDAPKYAAPCTLGAISSDGKFVAFFFGAEFLKAGVLDVAIAPKDGSTPFAIAFDKPAADSIAAKVAPAGTPTTTPTSTATNTAPVTAGSGATAPVVAVTPTTAAPPATTVPQSDAGRSPIANNVLKLAGLGDPDRGARAAALGGASVIVIGWWLLSTQSVRVPRLLGGMGGAVAVGDVPEPEKTDRMGGVARFARKRDRNALALR
jgi:hypothetical protein